MSILKVNYNPPIVFLLNGNFSALPTRQPLPLHPVGQITIFEPETGVFELALPFDEQHGKLVNKKFSWQGG